MTDIRFFVANLPDNVKESDINEKFADYGTIKNIDLKTPKGTTDATAKVIAFVTIQTDYANDCLNDLNGDVIQGCKIKVSIAKESFLERLKREREEQQQTAASTTTTDKNEFQANEKSDEVLPTSNRNRIIFTDEDFLIGNDDYDLITKKRASTSLRNGKIVIEDMQNDPLHTIEDRRQKSKQKLDDKALQADLKRKQSFKNFAEQYNQKKATVQKALQLLDKPIAKKIKFEYNDQPKLFDSADEDDDNGKEIKFKEKSAQLLKLQNDHDVSDKRFQMDEKFLDDDQKKRTKSEPEESERLWQMGILEQVVGRQLDHRKPGVDGKGAGKKQMLRYDPANKNQQKYLRAENDATLDLKETHTNIKSKQDDNDSVDSHNNTNEMFYTVSDSLTTAFKSNADEGGFSLLNMFGKLENETEKRNDLLNQASKEKILVSNMDWNAANPFTYDSTDTENEYDPLEEENELKTPKTTKTTTSKKNNIVLESFFFERSDARFEEGLQLFNSTQPAADDYNKVRDRLNLLIKTQINKKHKQKQLSNGHIRKQRKVK